MVSRSTHLIPIMYFMKTFLRFYRCLRNTKFGASDKGQNQTVRGEKKNLLDYLSESPIINVTLGMTRPKC